MSQNVDASTFHMTLGPSLQTKDINSKVDNPKSGDGNEENRDNQEKERKGDDEHEKNHGVQKTNDERNTKIQEKADATMERDKGRFYFFIRKLSSKK